MEEKILNIPSDPLDPDFEDLEKEDFLSKELYESLYQIEDPFEREATLSRLADEGRKHGILNVKKMYTSFELSVNQVTMSGRSVTDFTGQEKELYTTWEADDKGIRKLISQQTIFACTHPLTISRRIFNIDSRLERLEIAFRLNEKWRKVIVDKSILASAQRIIQLADYGISVTSENAKYLVQYIQELEDINYSEIPTVQATARLGWVIPDNFNEFMPYSENVEFDGDISFSRLFHSVKPEGSYQKWLGAMSMIRRSHVAGRIVIAASALSPILKIINAQPSFVHVWSSQSSTGKTLLIMGAGSFWGNPELGDYTQSFNATTVAMERTAETLNSCPMIVDELQLSRDYNGRQKFDVYKLAQGLGKGRGTKTGGIERTPTWCNTIITSGESPLVSESDGQGAFARVMDVQINEVIFNFKEGNKLAKTIKANYGFGGPLLIDYLKELGEEKIVEMFEEKVQELAEHREIQQKQIALGAGLLLADQIIDKAIFKDEQASLTMSEIIPFLRKETDSRIENRAYEFIVNWIGMNQAKFDTAAPECYGKIEFDTVYINSNLFKSALTDEGFNPTSVMSAMAKAEMIETFQEGGKTRYDTKKMLGNARPRCVAFKVAENDKQIELPMD